MAFAVGVDIANLPIMASDTSQQIVALTPTVSTPPPVRRLEGVAQSSDRPQSVHPRSGALVRVANRRSGGQPVEPMGSVPDSTEPYRKFAGEVPLPGYTLIQPLGRGGFGEVWKCEAPGGLLKAIKFVKGSDASDPAGGHQLRQEYDAFEQVKAIRHPFLLCLERVELVGNELVMVMGLADRHIGDRFSECRSAGLPGIPRDELTGYLREAAEALDVISAQYGLQHLDVKPANLFLTAGHLQVGDYGLVSKLDGGTESGKNRGLTPKYASPEVLRGGVHTQSDQYSLALVYQEMLTGCFPYSGRSAQQMMMQHVTAQPDLSSLPAADCGPVARALSKSPEQRFASCLDFIDALGSSDARSARRSSVIAAPNTPRPPAISTAVRLTAPANRQATGAKGSSITPAPHLGLARPKLQSGEMRSVVPTEKLLGRVAPAPSCTPQTVIDAVVSAAADGRSLTVSSDSVRSADGTWSCRFLTTVDPRLAKIKLELVWEEGGFAMDVRGPNRVVFRKIAPGLRFFGKKEQAGLEVVVDLPENGGNIGEVLACGRIFGEAKSEFLRGAEKSIAGLFAAISGALNNVQERRRHPRFPAEFPVMLIPLRSDGSLEPPLYGRCIDVSAGGLAIQSPHQLPSKYVYVAFDQIAGTRGLALLVQTIKSRANEGGFRVTGCYRMDL